MLKRLITPMLLMLCAFALATAGHFLPNHIAEPLVMVSMLSAALGLWQFVIKSRGIRKEMEDLQHLASFNITDVNQAQLSHFAHEVRTPMHGIIGMLDMIEKEQSPARIKAHLDISRKAAHNLLMVLNNNIDAAKAKHNELNFTIKTDSIADTCEHVVCLHAGNAQYKGLDFNLYLDPRLLDVELEFDRMRMQQILNNLLSNAIKYTTHGSIKLWVSLVNQHSDQMKLRFAVEDTGMGISDADINRLIQPFAQVDSAQSGNEANAGLGLYISNEILHKMASSLNIKSVLGQGTTMFFDIEFSCAKQRDSHAALPGTSVTILSKRGSDYELINQYLQHWKFDCQRLNAWDDLSLRRNNQTFIIDEMIAREHLSQLKQLLFDEKKRIIIVREHSASNDLLDFDWHDFKVLNKPILPSELTTLLFIGNQQDQAHTENDDTASIYQQLQDFLHENPAIKILCVDDNQVNQLVIKKQLQHLGFTFIQLADNGQQALHMVRDTHFDAVFMDFNMPILDGIKATKILRQRDYNNPILGVTALDDDESIAGLNAGMTTILKKPVNTDILAARLITHLVERQQRDGYEKETRSIESTASKKNFLMYLARHDTATDMVNDMLDQLGLSHTETTVLDSQLIRAEDLKGIDNVIVDISQNEYSQLRIARRLRRLGYKEKILALSPIETDLLRNTFQHFGFNKGGTAATLNSVLSNHKG